MKKTLTLLLVVCAICTATTTKAQLQCGSTEAEKAAIQQFPNILNQQAAYQAQYHNYIQTLDFSKLEKTRSGNYIIPIVFHVLHNYGNENISDAQIYDEMRVLNEDYSKTNADYANTLAIFKPIAANTGFEFRLAKKDPDGNCTNGIDRIYTYKCINGNDSSKLHQWNSNFYLNVWVTKTIGSAGVAGYAYKPYTVSNMFYWDGIIILNDYIGAVGTGTAFTSHALSHEIGHYLGLDHTWGGTNSPEVQCGVSDEVADTPETKGHLSCRLTDSTCHPGITENVQNFMEYSYCSTMFTQGQYAKMKMTLDSATLRKPLVSTLAYNATGIAQTSNNCPPLAEFYANKNFICSGTSVLLKDYSQRDSITGRTWNLGTGASPTTATSANPTVTFTQTGWQNIQLIAKSLHGADTLNNATAVFVANNTATVPNKNVPIQNFDDNNGLDNWPMFNYYHNQYKWEINQGNGLNGSNCIKYTGFDARVWPNNTSGDADGDFDDFFTPCYNLTGLGNGTNLNFWLAGATTSALGSNVTDKMQIFYSTNCGTNWTSLSTLDYTQLFPAGPMAKAFTPTSFSEWRPITIALPSSAINSNVFFKFRYNPSAKSNNIYIDDIGLSSNATPIAPIAKNETGFTIYPNPANADNIHMLVSSADLSDKKIIITDIIGNELTSISNTELMQYNGYVKINANSIAAKGIYFASLYSSNTKLSTQKFVVE